MSVQSVTSKSRLFHTAVAIALVSVAITSCSEPGLKTRCSMALKNVNRLIVVLAEDVRSVEVTIMELERSTPTKPWEIIGAPIAAVVGGKGLGWANGFQTADTTNVGLKKEGDKKTPAGVFRVGQPFGFSPSTLRNYMQLATGEHFCVDDVASKHYGRIVTRKQAGEETSGEAMREIDVYSNGIVVDYPPDRKAKSGSCIFLHVWTGPKEGTSGCVAMMEKDIERLQEFSSKEPTAIAIWPMSSLAHLQTCLGKLPKTLRDLNLETM